MNKMSKQLFHVWVEEEDIQQMEQIKREKTWTVSWQIREAIRLYLQTVKK